MAKSKIGCVKSKSKPVQKTSKLNRELIPSNGHCQKKNVLQSLKQTVQTESFPAIKLDIDVPAKISSIKKEEDFSKGEREVGEAVANALSGTVQTILLMLKREADKINGLMVDPNNNWNEEGVKARVNTMGSLVQSLTQVFTMNRINKGQEIGRVHHSHSWDNLSEKEVEDKLAEYDTLLANNQSIIRKKLTIEQIDRIMPEELKQLSN